MKIAFFDVQPWEMDILTHEFPDTTLTTEKLTQENISHYVDFEIVSGFISSHFSKEILDQLLKLKLIATRSTGFDHIDLVETKTKNILVSNVPEYGSHTVAEHTFALILTLTRKIYQSISQVKHYDFEHPNITGVDLYGKTIGVIGLGKIGIEVVQIAKGFGMKVLAYARHADPQKAREMGFEYVDLKTLFSSSDIVTLHLPYSPETHHLINKENIAEFKKGSFLINTARGGLIDTEAIIKALRENILAGVGLDVLEEEQELSEEVAILTSEYRSKINLETLILNHVLINHPHVVITPHNAFNSKEALRRILTTTIENIRAFEEGKPINVVR